ncbi:MAG: hypothetical protein JWM59_1447 [Verrucomicrobiales bacterium]|nr:hypothetical protein [Verrucomicrobiales bacterium]
MCDWIFRGSAGSGQKRGFKELGNRRSPERRKSRLSKHGIGVGFRRRGRRGFHGPSTSRCQNEQSIPALSAGPAAGGLWVIPVSGSLPGGLPRGGGQSSSPASRRTRHMEPRRHAPAPGGWGGGSDGDRPSGRKQTSFRSSGPNRAAAFPVGGGGLEALPGADRTGGRGGDGAAGS